MSRWDNRTHTLQRHPFMQGIQDRPYLLLPNGLPLFGAIDGVLAGDRREFCVCQRWLHGRKYGRGIVAQGRAMGRLPVRSGDSATPCQWGAALERHRQPRTQHDKQGAHAHRVP